MMVMFLGAVIVAYIAEAHGSPPSTPRASHGGQSGLHRRQPGRQGAALRHRRSALFDVVTTVTSCGAVKRHRVLHGIGGAVPSQPVGQRVIFGARHGPLFDLLYVLLAVFIGGLMVGRTPEWLARSSSPEIKLAASAS